MYSRIIQDLEFFNQNKNKNPLYRVDTDCCLYFDYDENKFCQNPSINNSARCAIHQDTKNTKFMKILAQLNKSDQKIGMSLSASAFWHFHEPKLVSDFAEYAPSLEGSVAAFKHASNNLKKILIAGFKSYKAGYLTSSTIPFQDNFFREQFPNEKNISRKQWMHSYLSLRVSTQQIIKSILLC